MKGPGEESAARVNFNISVSREVAQAVERLRHDMQKRCDWQRVSAAAAVRVALTKGLEVLEFLEEEAS